MWEFIHTSVQTGLQPHTSGFCPVAWTNGLPPHLVPLLEQMSAYHFLYPAELDPEGRRSPVELACRLVRYGAREWRIVGRIAGTELDYSGRLNRIAHLLIVPDEELPAEGAAAICAEEQNFMTSYHEPPQLLPVRRARTAASPSPGDEIWRQYRLDPGWSAAVATHFRRGSGEPFYCIFAPGTPTETLLGLIRSVTSKLTPAERLRFTFSTYFSQNVPGCECYFRCIIPPEGGRRMPGTGFSLLDPAPVPPELRPEQKVAAIPVKTTVVAPTFCDKKTATEPGDEIRQVNGRREEKIRMTPAIFQPVTKKIRQTVPFRQEIPAAIRRHSKAVLAGAVIIMLLLAALAVTLFRGYRSMLIFEKMKMPSADRTATQPAKESRPGLHPKTPRPPTGPQKNKAPGKRPLPPVPPPPVPQQSAAIPVLKTAVTGPKAGKNRPAPAPKPARKPGFHFEVRLPVTKNGAGQVIWSFKCVPDVPKGLMWEDVTIDASGYVEAGMKRKKCEKVLADQKKKREILIKGIADWKIKKDTVDWEQQAEIRQQITQKQKTLVQLNRQIANQEKALLDQEEKRKGEADKLARQIGAKAGTAEKVLRPFQKFIARCGMPSAQTARECEEKLKTWAEEEIKNENR